MRRLKIKRDAPTLGPVLIPRSVRHALLCCAEAFWQRSEWGTAMLRRLKEQPFDRAKGSPYALFTTRFANRWGEGWMYKAKEGTAWQLL